MNEILRALQDSGYRLTQPRLAVTEVLIDADDWLRPEDIHRRARQQYPALGLVTVYRTLALLAELGFVTRIHMEDGCHGYVRTRLDHSHHLVCRDCQQAIEFSGTNDLDELIGRLEERTGFLVQDHMLELLGLCPSCQPKSPAVEK